MMIIKKEQALFLMISVFRSEKMVLGHINQILAEGPGVAREIKKKNIFEFFKP